MLTFRIRDGGENEVLGFALFQKNGGGVEDTGTAVWPRRVLEFASWRGAWFAVYRGLVATKRIGGGILRMNFCLPAVRKRKPTTEILDKFMLTAAGRQSLFSRLVTGRR